MYDAPITRSQKGAFMLLLDQSGSMAEKITYQGELLTKAQALCYAVSEILEELISYSYRGFFVGDYFDVAIIGYSGTEATNMFGKGWKSIADIDQSALSRHQYLLKRTTPDGENFYTKGTRREWIEPKANGRTPLGEALRKARRLVQPWCRRHPDSFPPVVINITDGEATDASPDDLMALSQALCKVGTNDGNTIFINIHLAPEGHHRRVNNLCFPAESDPLPEGRHARLLYQISSTLPSLYTSYIEELRGGKGPFRGVCFNTAPSELVGMLSVGTITMTKLF